MESEKNESQSAPADTSETVTDAEAPADTQEAAPEAPVVPPEVVPEAAPPPPPAPTPAPVVEEAKVEPPLVPTLKIEDVAVVAQPPVTPASAPVAAAPIVTPLVTEDDDENVASLKIQLAAFSKAVMRPGDIPAEFKGAARLASQITQTVIKFPKVPVLNALLDFFEQNIDGVCARQNYMKGSTTLSSTEERQVGFLYNLFAELAQKKIVKIDDGVVIQVLKKPEIINFFNRKVSGFKQQAAQQ